MVITDLTSEQLLLLIVPALPNLWALHHAMYHDFPSQKEKSRWMMACVFLPLLGGIVYYAVGRKHALGRVDPLGAMRWSDSTMLEVGNDEDSKPIDVTQPLEDKNVSPASTGNRMPDEWSFGNPDEIKRKNEE